MREYQQKVKEFMVLAGQKCPDAPSIPSIEDRILRVRLSLEEVLEFAEASGIEISIPSPYYPIAINKQTNFNMSVVGDVDMLEIADSISDISYVNNGAAITYGLDIEPFEDAVHENNLTKISTGYRDEHGKLRKGPDYQPVNLKPILDAQINAKN